MAATRHPPEPLLESGLHREVDKDYPHEPLATDEARLRREVSYKLASAVHPQPRYVVRAIDELEGKPSRFSHE